MKTVDTALAFTIYLLVGGKIRLMSNEMASPTGIGGLASRWASAGSVLKKSKGKFLFLTR